MRAQRWTRVQIDRDKTEYCFLVCPENHVCGFAVNYKYFLNCHSPVMFKYPHDKNMEWCEKNWANDFHRA